MQEDWGTVEMGRGAEERILLRGARVRVLKGPDAGAEARVEALALTIGHGPLAGLRLSDRSVSREHVRIELGADGLRVSDGGSKNGTWIGGLRVDRCVLTQDAVLRIGETELEVVLDAERTELAVSGSTTFGKALGCSLPMRHLFGFLGRAAPQAVSVLLEGESGVGKEVLARAIHDASPRAAQPFVPVDCGAIPANLVESELFGHARGAFTGADRARVGLFEQADGGTIFLDEIGELPLDLQPKLLRVLEQREVRAVGANTARPVDVRVVAATNRSLTDEVKAGRFREDLFYRLAVARVRVPPLRERTEDIVPLATAFLRELVQDPNARLPPDVGAMLQAYAWPGNVRELKNVVGRFALLDARSKAELFEGGLRSGAGATARAHEDLSDRPYHEARKLVLDRLEAEYIPAVLARAGGVVSRAADLAGISRSSFYRMAERSGAQTEDEED
jgi:transcriptional regulator with PAS, ATPase and Fis domain